MEVNPRLFSLSNNLDSFVAALIGFALIQFFSHHSGIGVSPDSVTYLSAARHMGTGKGFTAFDNLPVVDFPIAYPFLLTSISFVTGLDPLQFGPYLNGFLFGLMIYISGSMMNGFEGSSRWYKRILLCCIILGPALQELYSLLWSETLFLNIMLLFILSISKYLRKPDLKWLIISSIICSLASLTRYAGVFLIATGVILIFFNREGNWRRRIFHSSVFGGISIFIFLINIIRNSLVTGMSMVPREKSIVGIWKNMEYFGDILSEWLLLDKSPGLSISLTMMVLLIFITVLAYQYFKQKPGFRFEYIVALTGLIYSLFMLFTSTISRYEQFTNRLLAPMFIPILWSMSSWIPGFIETKSKTMKFIFMTGFLLLAALFLQIQLRADFEYYDGVKDAGVPGYREDPFVQSDIVQFLSKHNAIINNGLTIYSNAADAVYFITGLTSQEIPRKYFPQNVAYYYTLKNNYLVWFNNVENDELPDLKTILANKKLNLVQQFADGSIYVTQ